MKSERHSPSSAHWGQLQGFPRYAGKISASKLVVEQNSSCFSTFRVFSGGPQTTMCLFQYKKGSLLKAPSPDNMVTSGYWTCALKPCKAEVIAVEKTKKFSQFSTWHYPSLLMYGLEGELLVITKGYVTEKMKCARRAEGTSLAYMTLLGSHTAQINDLMNSRMSASGHLSWVFPLQYSGRFWGVFRS